MTTPEQTARTVLAAASLFDPRIREPDQAVIRAWAAILGDIDPQAALAAVKSHYTTEVRPVMPADILRVRPVGNDPDRLPSAVPLRDHLTGRPELDPDRNLSRTATIRAALTARKAPEIPT